MVWRGKIDFFIFKQEKGFQKSKIYVALSTLKTLQ